MPAWSAGWLDCFLSDRFFFQNTIQGPPNCGHDFGAESDSSRGGRLFDAGQRAVKFIVRITGDKHELCVSAAAWRDSLSAIVIEVYLPYFGKYPVWFHGNEVDLAAPAPGFPWRWKVFTHSEVVFRGISVEFETDGTFRSAAKH